MPIITPTILIRYPIGSRSRLARHLHHGIRDGQGLDIIHHLRTLQPRHRQLVQDTRAHLVYYILHSSPSALGRPGLHRAFSPRSGERGALRGTTDRPTTYRLARHQLRHRLSPSERVQHRHLLSHHPIPTIYRRFPCIALLLFSLAIPLFGIPFPLSRHLGCIKGKADCTLGYYSPSAKTRRRDLGLTRAIWVILCIICGRPVAIAIVVSCVSTARRYTARVTMHPPSALSSRALRIYHACSRPRYVVATVTPLSSPPAIARASAPASDRPSQARHLPTIIDHPRRPPPPGIHPSSAATCTHLRHCSWLWNSISTISRLHT
ncbi:hypothetical protein BD626DRAFT_271848 [Schizophyllum amplum]|uniref:Uncharacterized protein n=1 Tax=Schizophyllum amplum TaxID=97359 RepID=A0A550CFI0_9AGAR|nr:hypothetical protein BD626DRAFT_271848 [Auriculariopsis ampla]